MRADSSFEKCATPVKYIWDRPDWKLACGAQIRSRADDRAICRDESFFRNRQSIEDLSPKGRSRVSHAQIGFAQNAQNRAPLSLLASSSSAAVLYLKTDLGIGIQSHWGSPHAKWPQASCEGGRPANSQPGR